MSVEVFKQHQIDKKAQLSELDPLDSTSKVSIFRLWINIVASLANTLKELYALEKEEINQLIGEQKLGTLNYYRETALAYRDGHPFNRESLTWAGTYTDAEIATSQIVKRAAIQSTEVEGRKRLFLKLATEDSGGNLAKIDATTLGRIKDYMQPNIHAGTYIEYFSDKADDLRFEIDVYIDTQILLETGERIDGQSNAPVFDAVSEFLADTNFKFDGEIVVSLLADKIQSVEGIVDRSVRFVKTEANFQTPAAWFEFAERYVSKSGYFDLTLENLTVNYLIN